MNDFTQMWVVIRPHEMNQLLAVGWKFVQVIYEPSSIVQEGFWSSKRIPASGSPEYLMGKPADVPERLKADSWNAESLKDYLNRVKEKKPEKEG